MSIINQNSTIFAPMEGITDYIYRQVVHNCYPAWDHIFTEFFRIPTHGTLKKDQIISHIGKDIYNNSDLFSKSVFQILFSNKTKLENPIKLINELNIGRLDLNFGCPSKTVVSHGGGSYFLDDLSSLKQSVKIIRSSFNQFLSAKIRIGNTDDKNFQEILQILEGEGIDAITVHPRTQKQMYTGISNWNYIKNAVNNLKIPVIGNGDINSAQQNSKMIKETSCFATMIGRSAITTPWIVNEIKNNQSLNSDETNKQIRHLLTSLLNEYIKNGFNKNMILNRLKAISNYMLKKFELDQRSIVLRADSVESFNTRLDSILEKK